MWAGALARDGPLRVVDVTGGNRMMRYINRLAVQTFYVLKLSPAFYSNE